MKPAIASIIATSVATETATTATERPGDEWYSKLNKSKLTPPPWVFRYVWPILYSLIIASFFVYLYAKYTIAGITLYIVQFVLNLTWSSLFFEQRMICASFIQIVVLNILVFFTYREFLSKSKIAAALLIPYMIWILFALYLNYYICFNN